MILVDTSAWYALLDESDSNHTVATRRWSALLDDAVLMTHSYVVLEATALVQNRLGMTAAARLHRALLPAARLLVVDTAIHHSAVARWMEAGSPGLSLVDCTSFTVMDSLAIESAFAYDPDFTAAGFAVVG